MPTHFLERRVNLKSWGAIVFSLITAGRIVGVWGGCIFFKKFCLYVILKLCTEFQILTMPATGQNVCGGGGVVWWWCGGLNLF